MSILGAGAGAASGLEEYLANQLMDQKFKQSQLEHSDDIALKSRQLDQSGDTQKSEAQVRAAQTQQILQNQADDKKRQDFEDEILSDPNASPQIKNYLSLRRATPKGESVPYQLITEPNGPTKETPATTVGNFSLDGKNIVAQRTHDGKVMYQGNDVTDKVTPYTPPALPSLGQSDAGFFLIPRTGPGAGQATPVTEAGSGGTQLPTKSPAQVLQRQDMAGRVGSHFDDLQKDLKDAEDQGLLGPMAGRTVSDFLGTGVGSTGDPAKDELLGNLRMDLSGVVTGFSSLHGRGGANAAQAQKLAADAFNAKKMSYSELKGGVDSLKKWVDGYAAPAKAPGATVVVPDDNDPLGLGLKK